MGVLGEIPDDDIDGLKDSLVLKDETETLSCSNGVESLGVA
jgi:hypothetical protein